MKVIYKNQVKALGNHVNQFEDAGIFVLFGDNAPQELADYCYIVSINPIDGVIAANQILHIDDQPYRITAVGHTALSTLQELGHCTFKVDGATSAKLPGTIHLEEKAMPDITLELLSKLSRTTTMIECPLRAPYDNARRYFLVAMAR